MKKLLILIIATAALASCNNTQQRNEKIKAAILSNVTKYLDKEKLEKVDSVSLISVDSLTDRSAYLFCLSSITTDSISLAQLADFAQQKVDNDAGDIEIDRDAIKKGKTLAERTDLLKYLTMNEEKMYPDSILLVTTLQKLTTARHAADSLTKRIATADDTKFSGYLVKAAYTIRTPNGTSEQQHNYLVSTEYKVAQY